MLTAGACRVWWASPALGRPSHEQLLDPVERRRRERLLRAADRDRFTVGVAISRLVLGEHLGVAAAHVPLDRTCPRCAEPHGRPTLLDKAARVEFSVSHSADRVVVAFIVDTQVGVDVEQIAPLREADLSRLVLTPTERADLARLGEADRLAGFFRYWTRKEAVVKAVGAGLTVPLTHLTMSAPDRPPELLRWRDGSSDFVLHDLDPGDGYAASLALATRVRDIAVHEMDATGLLSSSS